MVLETFLLREGKMWGETREMHCRSQKEYTLLDNNARTGWSLDQFFNTSFPYMHIKITKRIALRYPRRRNSIRILTKLSWEMRKEMTLFNGEMRKENTDVMYGSLGVYALRRTSYCFLCFNGTPRRLPSRTVFSANGVRRIFKNYHSGASAMLFWKLFTFTRNKYIEKILRPRSSQLVNIGGNLELHIVCFEFPIVCSIPKISFVPSMFWISGETWYVNTYCETFQISLLIEIFPRNLWNLLWKLSIFEYTWYIYILRQDGVERWPRFGSSMVRVFRKYFIKKMYMSHYLVSGNIKKTSF